MSKFLIIWTVSLNLLYNVVLIEDTDRNHNPVIILLLSCTPGTIIWTETIITIRTEKTANFAVHYFT